MAIKIAINGFGRIGRLVFREAIKNSEFEVVAVNDLSDAHQLAHLLKYDSVHGVYDADVQSEDDAFIVDGVRVQVFSEKDPAKLPWGELDIDVAIESTGRFRSMEEVSKHVEAGAKKAILSAPAQGEMPTYVMGVNHTQYQASENVISNASCTTNCLSPVAKVLDEKFGIKRGLMTTIHSYTNDQRILDFPHSDPRRARAGAVSMIPTTTGAAVAVSKVLPQLKGKLDGFSMRVPTPNVSCVDLVVELNASSVTVEDINSVLKEAAAGELKGILDYNELPLVSIDYNGNPHSSTVDGLSTMVLDNNMVKVLAWYDNEVGYSNRLMDLASYITNKQ
ncbi:type I glyceraldehyde-3-phosphate dehydrogenase [Ureibacillus chungkukjangi]|uniref:Glyceraldehyde-3-phosphate dehydrogenase n=1 Tax=Ureibacillus chungkukjangi TaxID=1202712 RepID=A0A318TPV3_9BACL|nr:type I glyceraldehyde-3-phosphate dehydrogenase [Ureibacillus chungkukjangi]MCM3388673.1 type I glyceraldehyde-3-phosphate dehydrogenase [Ureibacillus chungkukjangi]PYF05947.1 glyceraldehyde-3-phosphate dehydrogenase (NAD+) [Ureibacillus chungkukjangi]